MRAPARRSGRWGLGCGHRIEHEAARGHAGPRAPVRWLTPSRSSRSSSSRGHRQQGNGREVSGGAEGEGARAWCPRAPGTAVLRFRRSLRTRHPISEDGSGSADQGSVPDGRQHGRSVFQRTGDQRVIRTAGDDESVAEYDIGWRVSKTPCRPVSMKNGDGWPIQDRHEHGQVPTD